MDKKTLLPNIRYALLLALLFGAPLSKYPSLSLPTFNAPSFRIGLYQILAMLFVISCLPLIKNSLGKLAQNKYLQAGTALLLAVFGFGLATTLVPQRTLLFTAALFALLLLGVCSYLAYQKLKQNHKVQLLAAVLWSGVVFGGLSVVQLIVATLDASALGTLCSGCSSNVFGFPRINLFTAEPQFLANSLLPAFFAAVFFIDCTKFRRLSRWSLVLSSVAISLTFSRGAFLAIAGALTLYLLVTFFAGHKKSALNILKTSALSALFFLAGFGLLIASSTYRYSSSPNIAYNTVVSMIDHLSMGVVSIPQKTVEEPVTAPSPVPTNDQPKQQTGESFAPQGFVEASSNDRLGAAKLAVNAWNDNLLTVMFGVGIGNLGAYVQQHIDSSAPSNLTVYIYYVLLLSELGLIGGLVLCSPLFLSIARAYRKIALPVGGFVFSLACAFAIQFAFFGTYINTMYVWLLVGMFLAISWSQAKR